MSELQSIKKKEQELLQDEDRLKEYLTNFKKMSDIYLETTNQTAHLLENLHYHYQKNDHSEVLEEIMREFRKETTQLTQQLESTEQVIQSQRQSIDNDLNDILHKKMSLIEAQNETDL